MIDHTIRLRMLEFSLMKGRGGEAFEKIELQKYFKIYQKMIHPLSNFGLKQLQGGKSIRGVTTLSWDFRVNNFELGFSSIQEREDQIFSLYNLWRDTTSQSPTKLNGSVSTYRLVYTDKIDDDKDKKEKIEQTML